MSITSTRVPSSGLARHARVSRLAKSVLEFDHVVAGGWPLCRTTGTIRERWLRVDEVTFAVKSRCSRCKAARWLEENSRAGNARPGVGDRFRVGGATEGVRGLGGTRTTSKRIFSRSAGRTVADGGEGTKRGSGDDAFGGSFL